MFTFENVIIEEFSDTQAFKIKGVLLSFGILDPRPKVDGGVFPSETIIILKLVKKERLICTCKCETCVSVWKENKLIFCYNDDEILPFLRLKHPAEILQKFSAQSHDIWHLFPYEGKGHLFMQFSPLYPGKHSAHILSKSSIITQHD